MGPIKDYLGPEMVDSGGEWWGKGWRAILKLTAPSDSLYLACHTQ